MVNLKASVYMQTVRLGTFTMLSLLVKHGMGIIGNLPNMSNYKLSLLAINFSKKGDNISWVAVHKEAFSSDISIF